MGRLYLIWAVLRGNYSRVDHTEWDSYYPWTWKVDINIPRWYIRRKKWNTEYRSVWDGQEIVIDLLENEKN